MEDLDPAVRQARIERFFYHIVAELPRCVGNYVDRMDKAAVVAGFSFDTIMHRTPDEMISDKTHVILASDNVGALIHRIVSAPNDKLTRIWEILKEAE